MTCVMCILTLIATAQCMTATNGQWFPSGATLCSGTYSNIGWAGQMKIPIGATVMLKNPNFSSGSLIVEGTLIVKGVFAMNGAATIKGTLTVEHNLNVNVGNLTVESGGVINAEDFHLFNGGNIIAGIVNVSGTTSVHNPTTTFQNCGQLSTCWLLNVSSPNPITGNGFIKITGTYTGVNNLTSVSTITVAYSGTTSKLGAATRSMVNPCVVLPITYKKKSFRLVKVLY